MQEQRRLMRKRGRHMGLATKLLMSTWLKTLRLIE